MEDLNYLKVLYTLAWADSKIQEDEIKLLDVIQNELGIENNKEILSWQTNKLRIDDIKNIIFSEWEVEKRKYILFLAFLIAEVDGIFSKDEENFINELKILLNLENYDKQGIIDEVTSYYNKYIGKISK